MEHWKRNGTAEGKIFAHHVDHFTNSTVFWFCCFWQHTAITALYCPSGHLTSPPAGFSTCEQAQKERNEVWMRCQKVFSGSTPGTDCESETLASRPNEVQEVKVPQRNRSFPFRTGFLQASCLRRPFAASLCSDHCKKEKKKSIA